VNPNRKAQLAEDLITIEKHAGVASVGKYLKQSIPQLVTVLAATGASAGLAYLLAKKKLDSHQEDIKKSYTSLMVSNPAFQKNPGLFHQRFSELSLISPTLASNPTFATKLIQPRMDKGFNLNDVHRLSSIEHNVSNSGQRHEHPLSAAQPHLMLGLSDAIKTIGPAISKGMSEPDQAKILRRKDGGTFVHTEDPHLAKHLQEVEQDLAEANFHPEHLQAMMEDVHAQYTQQGLNPDQVAIKMRVLQNHILGKQKAVIEKWSNHPHEDVQNFLKAKLEELVQPAKPHEKKGAAMQPVSEECLGRMLADTHLMCKEAGMLKNVTNFLKPSAKEVGNYMKAMTIPLVLGVGIKMVQGYMDSRNKANMHQEADKVFAQLSRTSESIQENPQIAAQAFDALKSFAPALAVKPMIAKTFVENVVNHQGQLDPMTTNMLAQTQQTIQSLDKHTGGFISGLKEPMSIFSFKTPHAKEKDKA
jgi:hypothetical protein